MVSVHRADIYRKSDLQNDIKKMNIDSKGTLLIHSSMKAVGNVDGGADTVLDVWSEYMKDGLLIFPTHTWDRVGKDNPVFDVKTDSSCVGILGNLFMKRPNVIRSLHPTHSVAVLGNDAESFVNDEEKIDTPCGRKGCWGKLYDRNATIIFLGCTLKSNTFIHGVEEWNAVPDRISEETETLKIIDYNGHEIINHMHRHRCTRAEDISRNYDKLEPVFLALGAIKYGQFGDAQCVIGNAVKMADITSILLKKNPDLFLNDKPVPESWYKKL